MNRTTGKAPVPAVPTSDRAAEIRGFWEIISNIQAANGLRIKGDGLEIHDDYTPGEYPAIVTEDGKLEIFTAETLAEGEK